MIGMRIPCSFLKNGHEQMATFIFSHPDYTVGFGFSPNHALTARGLRSFIASTPPVGNFTTPRR